MRDDALFRVDQNRESQSIKQNYDTQLTLLKRITSQQKQQIHKLKTLLEETQKNLSSVRILSVGRSSKFADELVRLSSVNRRFRKRKKGKESFPFVSQSTGRRSTWKKSTWKRGKFSEEFFPAPNEPTDFHRTETKFFANFLFLARSWKKTNREAKNWKNNWFKRRIFSKVNTNDTKVFSSFFSTNENSRINDATNNWNKSSTSDQSSTTENVFLFSEENFPPEIVFSNESKWQKKYDDLRNENEREKHRLKEKIKHLESQIEFSTQEKNKKTTNHGGESSRQIARRISVRILRLSKASIHRTRTKHKQTKSTVHRRKNSLRRATKTEIPFLLCKMPKSTHHVRITRVNIRHDSNLTRRCFSDDLLFRARCSTCPRLRPSRRQWKPIFHPIVRNQSIFDRRKRKLLKRAQSRVKLAFSFQKIHVFNAFLLHRTKIQLPNKIKSRKIPATPSEKLHKSTNRIFFHNFSFSTLPSIVFSSQMSQNPESQSEELKFNSKNLNSGFAAKFF